MKSSTSISIVLLVLLSTFNTSSVFARTFTTMTGVPIEGSLIGVKTSGNTQIAILQLDRTGRPYEIPLSRLSSLDQQFIKSSKAPGQASATASVPTNGAKIPVPTNTSSRKGPSVFSGLSTKLVSLKGNSVTKHKMGAEPTYYAFYFSASWCGPCRAFTPMLVRFYNRNKEARANNPNFEIIFVSRDNDKNSMDEYMRDEKMPWPAIRYSDVKKMRQINKYAGPGIPCLVVVDRAGNVISDTYVNGKSQGPMPAMRDLAKYTGGN